MNEKTTKILFALALALLVKLPLLLVSSDTQAADPTGLLKLGGRYVKWGPAAYGTPAEITYARLTEARAFPGARNCAQMRPVDALLQRSGLVVGEFDREVDAAFAVWAKASNLRFRRVARAQDAQIIIGAQGDNRGIAWTNVFQERQAASGIDRIRRATICLNPARPWEIGADGDPETFNLRYVAVHEIGHAIGLDHQGRDGGVMGFAYREPATRNAQVRLAASDVTAAIRLYGPAEGTAPVRIASRAAGAPGATQPCATETALSPTIGCGLAARAR